MQLLHFLPPVPIVTPTLSPKFTNTSPCQAGPLLTSYAEVSAQWLQEVWDRRPSRQWTHDQMCAYVRTCVRVFCVWCVCMRVCMCCFTHIHVVFVSFCIHVHLYLCVCKHIAYANLCSLVYIATWSHFSSLLHSLCLSSPGTTSPEVAVCVLSLCTMFLQ